MTRFVHDQFAKECFEELLKNYGIVKTSVKILGEIKEIDILFTPYSKQSDDLQQLGLLGRFAKRPAIIEPFRNAASASEISKCIVKVLEVKEELTREAKSNKTDLLEVQIPQLWILTPTASETLLSGFNVKQKEGFTPGIYFLGDNLFSAIVAIHQLPKTSETLWLRLFGRGSVQEQAILELQNLSQDNPFKAVTLELIYNLRENLKTNQNNLEQDDRNLIMRLEPLYQQDRERAKQEGREEEREEGKQRLIKVIMRLLNRRIGEIEASLIERVQSLSIEQLENLGEALLDLKNVSDLEAWLNQN